MNVRFGLVESFKVEALMFILESRMGCYVSLIIEQYECLKYFSFERLLWYKVLKKKIFSNLPAFLTLHNIKISYNYSTQMTCLHEYDLLNFCIAFVKETFKNRGRFFNWTVRRMNFWFMLWTTHD